MATREAIVDTIPLRFTIVEASTEDGVLRAKGEFARADVPTLNKRLYPRAEWEREIRRLANTIATNQMFGELDHPDETSTKLRRSSHVVTSLKIDSDGIIYGEARVMDTAAGRDLMAIFKAGGTPGVSSRGVGTMKMREDGISVVTDFQLISFDFVANPADKFALPTLTLTPEAVAHDEEQNLTNEKAEDMSGKENIEEKVADKEAPSSKDPVGERATQPTKVGVNGDEPPESSPDSDPESSEAGNAPTAEANGEAVSKALALLAPFLQKEQFDAAVNAKTQECDKAVAEAQAQVEALKAELAATKTTLESVTAEKAIAVESLDEVSAELHRVTLSVWFDRTVSDLPEAYAPIVRLHVPKPEIFESVSALENEVRKTVRALDEQRDIIEREKKIREDAIQEAVESYKQQVSAELAALKKKTDDDVREAREQRERAEKQLAESKRVHEYAKNSIEGHSKAPLFWSKFQESTEQTQESVDRIIESLEDTKTIASNKLTIEHAESIRSRIHRLPSIKEEPITESVTKKGNPLENLLGSDFEEVLRIAGQIK